MSDKNTSAKQVFAPGADWTLISQGAEGRIWKIPNYQHIKQQQQEEKEAPAEPFVVIAKERFSKAYRHPVLDERLTKQRCRMEARILEKCHKKNLPVPKVVRIDAPVAVLYLEYIQGITVREYLQQNENEKDDEHQNNIQKIASSMGGLIGTLHYQLGVIHGDLTTSNMMVPEITDPSKIILIDFGLAKNTESAEERAVDLYVLERALESTHPNLPTLFWKTFENSYSSNSFDDSSKKNTIEKAIQATLARLDQVRQRGRKRECFG